MPRSLSDAKEKHIALGKGPRNKTARQQFDRAWDQLMAITGDAIITDVRRHHANRYVEKLLARGISGDTVSKYVYQIKPVLDTAIREFELGIANPFEGLTIPGKGKEKPRQRFPYSPEELCAIQTRCRQKDDERRWAIAMLSDTGARQAEIVGLLKADVMLTAEVPHIHIRPNGNRGLKTPQSARKVPLVGAALWAAGRAMTTEGEHLFPAFQPKRAGKEFNPNSASAALNKWLKESGLARAGQGLHSFRHSLVDRLRNAGVAKDKREQIGGWKSLGVSEGYGEGFQLSELHEAMKSIAYDREAATAENAG